jgi:hypothetical protein
MDIARVDQVLPILLPTFAIGALLGLPRGVTRLWRLVTDRDDAARLPADYGSCDRSSMHVAATPLGSNVHNSLARPELRRLLHTLPEAELVLPPRCQFVRARWAAMTQPLAPAMG